MTDERRRRTWNARYPLLLSFTVIVLLVTLVGAWAMRVNISGAVIGSGTIEASKIMTAVQHPVGGVIEEILISNGDTVKAGDVVVRLEDIQLKSDLAVVEDNLFEVLANMARLEAVIDGSTALDLSPEIVEAATSRPDIKTLVARQERQLAAHYEALETEARLLDKQLSQVAAQIEGLDAQMAAKREEMGFVLREIERMTNLDELGLLKQSDLFTLQKSRTTVRGEIARFEALKAELLGKTSEIELKRHTIIPKERKLALAELSKLRPERTKFQERRNSLRDQLRKLEIRAPISGRIHDIRVQGIRSVVVAAKPLMMIIPDSQPRSVSVKIRDTDIDQVTLGQAATLKFMAFDGRHMPVIFASVTAVSADALLDQLTQKKYYEVTLEFSEDEMLKLGDRQLKPGMPIDAFLATESRTPLNYVLRPLKTYFDRAFRDA